MNRRIIWSKYAEEQLDDIYMYYFLNVGEDVSKQIVSGIIEETIRLTVHPFIGQKEPLLAHREGEYRYLVCGNYKIIYLTQEEDNIVKIIDVFDTRQNPIKMIF